jgi:K+-sensing histidine kinase KdpD
MNVRYQLRHILVGVCCTLFLTTISSFVLPYFSIFVFATIDSIWFIVFLSLVTYSILKHNLFDIKIITIEIITFGLWVFEIIRISQAENIHDLISACVLFLVTLIMGILLIKSTLNEVRQAERLEKISKDMLDFDKILDGK